GSGVTLFIEPLPVMELANQWRELAMQEQEEVERILREISGRIAPAAKPLNEMLDALALIDFAFARAHLAEDMRAERPEIEAIPEPGKPRNVILLHQARHPLLTGTVVPIDLELGG